MLAGLLGLVFGTCGAYGDDEVELPMPRWLPGELDAMRANPNLPPVLGGLLGGIDEMGDAPEPTPLLLGEMGEGVVDSPERSQPALNLSRFLPLSLLNGGHGRPDSRPPAILKDVPPAFIRECREKPEGTRLIDPNHELSEPSAEDFERFLAFHANDSQIPFTVVILGSHQQLPIDANVGSFASGSVCSGTSGLLVYPYGQPSRARLFVSRAVREGAASGALDNLMDDGMREAMRATDPDEQLHRLLVQLSIRLFWLERSLVHVSAVVEPVKTPSHNDQGQAMAEVRPLVVKEVKPVGGHFWLYGCLLALAVAGYSTWRWQRFKMRHYEWLLPTTASKPAYRFGGQSCGGGVAIHYR